MYTEEAFWNRKKRRNGLEWIYRAVASAGTDNRFLFRVLSSSLPSLTMAPKRCDVQCALSYRVGMRWADSTFVNELPYHIREVLLRCHQELVPFRRRKVIHCWHHRAKAFLFCCCCCCCGKSRVSSVCSGVFVCHNGRNPFQRESGTAPKTNNRFAVRTIRSTGP